MKKKKNTDKKITRRTLRLEARVTEQEYTQVAELAKTCGLSMSGYIRRTALGQHPRAIYFSDTRFVEQWMRAATQLINRWSQIENYLTE